MWGIWWVSAKEQCTLVHIPNSHSLARTPKYKEASYITGISTHQKATPIHPETERSIEMIDTMQEEDQPSFTAQKGQVGDWLPGVSHQDPAINCHRTVHVVSVLRGYAWRHTPCCTSVYIVLHVCIFYSACTWRSPIRPKLRSCIWVMKSLSDLVNDSEDCSGEPAKAIFTSVTELLTVFSLREWLFGIWTSLMKLDIGTRGRAKISVRGCTICGQEL